MNYNDETILLFVKEELKKEGDEEHKRKTRGGI